MAAPKRQLHQKGRETLATAAKRSVSKFVPESESVRMWRITSNLVDDLRARELG